MTSPSRERAAKAIAHHLAQAILIALETLDENRAPTPLTPAVTPGRSPRALLDVNELSVRLGVSVKTIYAWRTHRPPFGPPAMKIGKYLRWKPEVVEAWITEQQEG